MSSQNQSQIDYGIKREVGKVAISRVIEVNKGDVALGRKNKARPKQKHIVENKEATPETLAKTRQFKGDSLQRIIDGGSLSNKQIFAATMLRIAFKWADCVSSRRDTLTRIGDTVEFMGKSTEGLEKIFPENERLKAAIWALHDWECYYRNSGEPDAHLRPILVKMVLNENYSLRGVSKKLTAQYEIINQGIFKEKALKIIIEALDIYYDCLIKNKTD